MTLRYSFVGGEIAHLANSTSFNMGSRGQMMDAFGNFWAGTWGNTGTQTVQVIDQSGAILVSYDMGTVFTDVCTYILAHQAPATSWLSSAPDASAGSAAWATFVLGGVSYHVATMRIYQGVSFGTPYWYQAVAVYTSNAAAAITLQGVVWSNPLTALANGGTLIRKIDLCGAKTINDEIFIAGQTNDATGAPAFFKYPSIAAIIGKCSGLTQNRILWGASWFNSGDTYFGLGMLFGLGINAAGDQSCFVMPNAAGGTDLYVYVNKETMASTSVVYLTASVQPTYPDGAMVKGTLPADSPAFTTGTPATSDILITGIAPAPGCFVDANGTPYDAFSDVQLNVDGSAGSGVIDYYPVPRVLMADGADLIVAWYQPWFTDTSYTGSNWAFYEKLRIQRYTPSTGTFTDISLLQGPTIHITDIGTAAGQPNDFIDVVGWAVFADGAEVKIWHLNGPSATGSARWVTWLSNIGVRQVGQVTVHTRIGASRAPIITTPVNIALPSISGTPDVGETLTGDTGTWTGNP